MTTGRLSRTMLETLATAPDGRIDTDVTLVRRLAQDALAYLDERDEAIGAYERDFREGIRDANALREQVAQLEQERDAYRTALEQANKDLAYVLASPGTMVRFPQVEKRLKARQALEQPAGAASTSKQEASDASVD